MLVLLPSLHPIRINFSLTYVQIPFWPRSMANVVIASFLHHSQLPGGQGYEKLCPSVLVYRFAPYSINVNHTTKRFLCQKNDVFIFLFPDLYTVIAFLSKLEKDKNSVEIHREIGYHVNILIRQTGGYRNLPLRYVLDSIQATGEYNGCKYVRNQ